MIMNHQKMHSHIYGFSARDLQGREVNIEKYKGKTLLIVNTASKCGFTPQLQGLEELYRKHQDQLVVLGFPCNQFSNQEPGDDRSVAEGCVRDYGVTFPMFSKVRVNGRNAHPLFKYLKKELRGFPGSRIKWNFTKFLIDSEGKPLKRFSPMTAPDRIEKYLKRKVF